MADVQPGQVQRPGVDSFLNSPNICREEQWPLCPPLGYRFGSDGLTGVAAATVERFVEKATRLATQDDPGVASSGQRVGRDLPGVVSALVERVVGGETPTATGPGDGAPSSGKKGTAAATEEPCSPARGPKGPMNEREPRLYEQATPAKPAPGLMGLEGLGRRCGDNVRRWCRRVTSGLRGLPLDPPRPGGVGWRTSPLQACIQRPTLV